MDFVVSKGDVVLEDGVPFLQDNFFEPSVSLLTVREWSVLPSAGLSGYQFLEIANSISWIGLDAHLFAEAIIYNDFDHF